MITNKIQLPSNKKFGIFFSSIFFIFAWLFFYFANLTVAYSLIILSIIFMVITTVKAELLLPLNKLWMKFGMLLGMIISPIVLGIIFFGIFTPCSIFMKIIGRDELNLKKLNLIKDSNWKKRNDIVAPKTSFLRQF